MDPQTYLQRILDAIAANDRDEFQNAFEDLAEWLAKGGEPPKCTTLGMGKMNVGYPGMMVGSPPKTIDSPRKIISSTCKRYAIMQADANDASKGYVFVVYNWAGTRKLATYILPKE